MGEFDRRVRELRESELACPKCKTSNVPGRSKDIELDAHRMANCSHCGHMWVDKEP